MGVRVPLSHHHSLRSFWLLKGVLGLLGQRRVPRLGLRAASPLLPPSLATLVLVAQGGPRASRPAARPAPRPSSGESTPPPITRYARSGCSRGSSGFSASGASRASAFERRVHSPLASRTPSLRSAGSRGSGFAGAIASLGGLNGASDLSRCAAARLPLVGQGLADHRSDRRRHRGPHQAPLDISRTSLVRAKMAIERRTGSPVGGCRLALRAASPLSHQSLPGIQHPARQSVLVGHADLRRRPRKVSGRIRHATGETSAGTAARSTRCVRPRNGLPSRLLIYTKRRRQRIHPGTSITYS